MLTKIAVVLPKLSRFDYDQPTSIDSVVRQLVEHSSFDDNQIVFHPPTKSPITSVPTKEYCHENPVLWKWRLRKAISECQPACIEVHQSVYLADNLAKQFSNLPIILFRHNLINRSPNPREMQKYLSKMKNVSSFVFVSEFAANHFRSSWPEYADRAHAVPNFASQRAWFSPIEENRSRNIFYLGRPIAEKGFEEFCESITPVLLKHRGWSATICVYEWERYKAYAQPIIDKLVESTDNVKLLVNRPVDEVRDAAKQAEIVVVPSKWNEPFGLAALEAHLAGSAVVSSGRGGLKEVSEDAAYYLSEVTPAAITQALYDLICDDKLRLRLKCVGQARCLEKFDPKNIVKRYDSIRLATIDAFTAKSYPRQIAY